MKIIQFLPYELFPNRITIHFIFHSFFWLTSFFIFFSLVLNKMKGEKKNGKKKRINFYNLYFEGQVLH